MENNLIKVGAVWYKTSKNGKNYSTMSLDLSQLQPEVAMSKDLRLVQFDAKFKKSDKSPDAHLFFDAKEKPAYRPDTQSTFQGDFSEPVLNSSDDDLPF